MFYHASFLLKFRLCLSLKGRIPTDRSRVTFIYSIGGYHFVNIFVLRGLSCYRCSLKHHKRLCLPCCPLAVFLPYAWAMSQSTATACAFVVVQSRSPATASQSTLFMTMKHFTVAHAHLAISHMLPLTIFRSKRVARLMASLALLYFSPTSCPALEDSSRFHLVWGFSFKH